ncbi:unnamed protein product [Linum tenue]|uniref:Aminotransferase-like plant mobile domain-containing protein n=1 Tax=Linum tenue TaxID=586396 RepID=A0AAV0J523_9ROSI|nr:unnamed protein product [Linum tenue]
MEFDNNFLTTLVERWRTEMHTFHFLEGEMMITLKDVALLTELPIIGKEIIEIRQVQLEFEGFNHRLGLELLND